MVGLGIGIILPLRWQVRTHAQKYILKLSRMGSASNKVCLLACFTERALSKRSSLLVRLCALEGLLPA